MTQIKRRKYISLDSIERICRALDCSVDDILEFIDEGDENMTKMAGNEGLARAGRNKKDEFYTQLTDIEKRNALLQKTFQRQKQFFVIVMILLNLIFFKYFCT